MNGESDTPEQQTLTVQEAMELAVQHHGAGRLSEAGNIYQQILQVEPNHPVALHLLGLIAHQAGNHDTAVEIFMKALAIKPDYALAHSNLGNALKALEKPEEAIASYQKAIDINPDLAEVHYNLGTTFQDFGKVDEAVQSFRKALTIKPDYPEAHGNLGIALQYLGRPEEAMASYHKALAIKPDFAEAHINLGNVHSELGQPGEAVESHRKALAIEPESAMAHNNLANALKDLGKLEEAAASYRQALTLKPDFAEAHSNLIFPMSYDPGITSDEIFQQARQWDAKHGYKGEKPEYRNPPEPDRRLRIGLVSGDFRHHSVSYFLKTVVSEIDKEKLEIFAYATSSKEDDLTAQLKSIVAHWRNVTAISDKQLSEDIMADGIDILVDLSGHSAFNRLKVFSMKPAPIQVAWLGYSATTGVDAFDYILCDQWVLPPEGEEHFIEKSWRLPGSYLCFSPPDVKVDVAASPVRSNSYITFGCFNHLTKMTDPVVSCWAKILHKVPDSRLFLKAGQLNDVAVQKEVLSRFSSHGVFSDVLFLKGYSPDKSTHFAAYNQVDISLDPFPYAGTTTSFEALWMGTPLLTLQGDRFISRVGESILNNVGLGEWIGATPQDYVDKAIAFASDLQGLSVLREGMRDRLMASCLCDAPGFTRNLEEAFRGMWRTWCK